MCLPGLAVTGRTQQVATASVTTSAAGTLLLAAYYGYNAAGRKTTWSAPSWDVGALRCGQRRSAASLVNSAQQAAPARRGEKVALGISDAGGRAVTVLLALQPPPPPPSPGPVPLIVDLDMFSDADDAGAWRPHSRYSVPARHGSSRSRRHPNQPTGRGGRFLALRGRGRGATAADSTPIGAPAPADGREPVPRTGPGRVRTLVRVSAHGRRGHDVPTGPGRSTRRQRRHRIAGYLANLAASARITAGRASSLTGPTRRPKVRLLVAMAGGYPNAASETISRNIAAARAVASAGRPGRVGRYEIGDAVAHRQMVSTHIRRGRHCGRVRSVRRTHATGSTPTT